MESKQASVGSTSSVPLFAEAARKATLELLEGCNAAVRIRALSASADPGTRAKGDPRVVDLLGVLSASPMEPARSIERSADKFAMLESRMMGASTTGFAEPARDFSMSHRDLIRGDLALLERFFLDGSILQQQMVKYSVSPLYAQAEAACGGTDLDGGAFAL